MNPARFTLVAAALLGLPAVGVGPRLSAEDDVEAIYQRVVKSAVYIAAPPNKEMLAKIPPEVKARREVLIAWTGSGTLIDVAQRLVLTNFHVVEGCDYVYCQFPIYLKDKTILTDKNKYKDRFKRGEGIRAKVLYHESTKDLAIIQLDKVPPGTPALPISKESVTTGMTTWNVGSPGAVDQVFSITEGKVRSVAKERFHVGGGDDAGFEVHATMISSSNASNPGDSGGPLVDKRGVLVGVTQSGQFSQQLLSKFVDVSEVRTFLSEHKTNIKDLLTGDGPPSPGPGEPKDPGAGSSAGSSVRVPLSPEEAYQRVLRSSVFIVAPVKGDTVTGSGSLIDVDKKLVVTMAGLVEGSDTVFVQFPVYEKGVMLTSKSKYIGRIPDGLAIKGTVRYRDQGRDLALIELEKLPPGAVAVPLAKKGPAVGATVWSIGSPEAADQVFGFTEGKVRSIGNERLEVGGSRPFTLNARMVTTTNPINKGDDGGPLFDHWGHQVGVAWHHHHKAQLVSKFIDVSEVRAFLAQKKIQIKELDDDGPALPPKKDTVVPTPPKKDTLVTPPPKVDTPPAPTPGAPTAADEQAAAMMLASAKVFKNDEDKTYFAGKLKAIVAKYPNTAAGKEAKKLLDAIK